MNSLVLILAVSAIAQSGPAPLREHAPAFSPDGRQIAYYSYRNGLPDIYVFDRVSGSVTRQTETEDRWEIEPDWMPDGDTLLFPSGISMRRLVPHALESGATEALPVPLGLRTTGPTDVTPDGSGLYFIENREAGSRLWRVDIGGPGHLVSDELPAGRNGSPHATPDGMSVIFLNTPPESEAADLYRLDLHSRQIARLTHTPWNEGYPSITPDSRRIIFSAEIGDETRDIYHIPVSGHDPAARPLALLPYRGNTRFFADMSVDGAIAYDEVSDDGGVRIYILDAGAQTPRLLPETGNPAY